jgi:hypothetical protein
VGGSISCCSLVFLAEEMVAFYFKLPLSWNSHFSLRNEIRRHSYDPVGFLHVPACLNYSHFRTQAHTHTHLNFCTFNLLLHTTCFGQSFEHCQVEKIQVQKGKCYIRGLPSQSFCWNTQNIASNRGVRKT